MSRRILVVDDDPHIREVVCFALEKAGLETTTARDGADALTKFAAIQPHLVVLDVGMPEIDGLEVCRRIRKIADTPILFLSARDEEIDRILGLEMGGDDYVAKPFSPRELVARVNAILKRAIAPAATATPEPLRYGALTVDAEAHRATFAEKALALTAVEFSILQTLLARPGMVFTREKILDSAYPGNIHVSDRTIDSHIRNIRNKLQEAGCAQAIETVHGVGFRLGACEPAA